MTNFFCYCEYRFYCIPQNLKNRHQYLFSKLAGPMGAYIQGVPIFMGYVNSSVNQWQQSPPTFTRASTATDKKRHQYSRKKLEIVTYYYETAKENKYRTCQQFSIDKKCLQRRIAKEETIRKVAWGASGSVAEGEHFGQTWKRSYWRNSRSCGEKA